MSRELAPRIVVDAGIRFGKPVIVGTRVPVETLVLRLSQGMSVTEVAEEYGMSTDDVLAAHDSSNLRDV